MTLVAEYERRGAWQEDGATSMVDWLVARLAMTRSNARAVADVSRALPSLPSLAAAFESGELSFDQLRPLATVATPDNEAALAAEAPGWSAQQCEVVGRHARRVSEAESRRRHNSRYLRLWHDEDRSLRIWGLLPEEQGAVVAAEIFRLADQAGADPVTGTYGPLDARCADALVGVCSTRLAEDADADRATIVVHVDAAVLAGGDGAAELEGGSDLSSRTVRRLACDSRLQMLVERSDGAAVGLGRTTRTVPPWLLRQLRRRDRGCRFPGCGRARWLHAHHVQHWSDGGTTDPVNLVLLCTTHHHLLHEGRWQIRGSPMGELRFVSPGNKVLTSRPAPLDADVRMRFFDLPDTG